jgi:hypothetical protein
MVNSVRLRIFWSWIMAVRALRMVGVLKSQDDEQVSRYKRGKWMKIDNLNLQKKVRPYI